MGRGFPGILLFIISFLWFCFPGEYVLIANRDLSLFLFTPEYLGSFLKRPGGLLEYTGSFLTQFYRFRITGALVLSAVITSAYFVSGSLLVRISGNIRLVLSGLLTSLLLLGMHNYYPHQIGQSLGLILSIGLVALLPSPGRSRIIFLALSIPLFYLFSGGFIWFYCGLVIGFVLLGEKKVDLRSLLLTTLYPGALIFFASSLLFLDPLKSLIINPLPFGESYGKSPWPTLFFAWMLLWMLLAQKPFRISEQGIARRMLTQVVISVFALALVVHFSYNRKNREFYHIENLALQQEWDELLSYTAEKPSMNLFGVYYANLALANQGMLCSNLFQYPQSFGRRALCFNWEAKAEILRRGSDFFWAVHFVNEAHHWAFESMIINGYTRRNLRMLIQTELVRGNYKVVEKYVCLLGKALFQKKIYRHYARFLDDREAIKDDPELGPRLKTGLTLDFFADGVDLEVNLRSLLASDPSNLKAHDYLMALFLLEKKIDQIETALPAYLKASEGFLPPLLEESLLVYQLTHRDMGQSPIRVSPSTLGRFDAYTKVLRQYRDQNEAARMLFPSYGSTFWFYYNFVHFQGNN